MSLRGQANFGTLAVGSEEVNEVVMTVAEQLEKKGKEIGRREGQAKAVLAVLAARGIAVPATIRKRILACTDLAVLDKWVARAVTVSKAADLVEG